MKYVFFCLLFFCYLLVNAQQPKNSSNSISNIEASTNYTANIEALEAELTKPQKNDSILLQLQIILLSNYINVFQYNKATEFCQKEIIAAKKNNLPYREALFYRYLGNVYYHLKQIDNAYLYWNKCLSLSEDHHYYSLLERCNHNMGVIAFETEKDYAKAETYFLKAIEYGKKTVSTKQENLANNYRLLATTYDIIGKYKMADSLFEKTISIYKSFNDSAGLAEALTFQARLYLSMKKFEKASVLCKEAIIISKRLKLDDYLQTALSIQKLIAEETNNYKEAYYACNEMLNIETAKQARNQKKEIAESEAKFKVAEFKNLQELSELKAKQSKLFYLYTFIVLFIVGVALVIFYYQKRHAKKEEALKLESLKTVYEAEEKERARIAKDLHDNMGAYATSILAQIDLLEYTDNHLKKDKVLELRQDAEHIMSTLRETIWILKNKTISTKQLFDLIRLYVDKHLVKNIGIKVLFTEDVSKDKLLSPTVSLNVYRIMQEIIQNIIKHAQATEVTCKLTCHQILILEITDNGKGFDISQLSRKSGLDNMQYRAQEIGFTITFESQMNTSTHITLQEN